jgi:hypothetical protein
MWPRRAGLATLWRAAATLNSDVAEAKWVGNSLESCCNAELCLAEAIKVDLELCANDLEALVSSQGNHGEAFACFQGTPLSI